MIRTGPIEQAVAQGPPQDITILQGAEEHILGPTLELPDIEVDHQTLDIVPVDQQLQEHPHTEDHQVEEVITQEEVLVIVVVAIEALVAPGHRAVAIEALEEALVAEAAIEVQVAVQGHHPVAVPDHHLPVGLHQEVVVDNNPKSLDN